MESIDNTLSLFPSSTIPSSSIDLPFLSIDYELWLIAEQRIHEILCVIQPTSSSEKKRKEVVEYIQNLVKDTYATEVFLVGSVPYKTYLPDGDIDLTVLTHKALEEDLAHNIYNIFKCEEQDSQFLVKDVQYVQAQVKIVKCTVKDISVDISFNQLRGLCALGFLEQVDQLIEKDHLFKRSVILIKAWCFYESRILGAHHGLISSYALEILVLHIINLFHASLPAPLAVLLKFLNYYSSFDWENYYVSITGPVPISLLSGAVGLQEYKENELLLSPEILRSCKETFSISTKAFENENNGFPLKYMNIIDPLNQNNNLGRCISKGTSYRIKSALCYGSQKLLAILALPGERMSSELEKFFINTLNRNGKGERPDAEVPVPAFGTGRSEASVLSMNFENHYWGLLHCQWYFQSQLYTLTQLSPQEFPLQTEFSECNGIYSHIPDVFIPSQTLGYGYTWRYASACGIKGMPKSQGTGTFIPKLASEPYRDLLMSMEEGGSDSPRSPSFKSAPSINPSRDRTVPDTSRKGYRFDRSVNHQLPEKESRQTDISIDLSIDQFPALPSRNQSNLSGGQPSCQQPLLNKFQASEDASCFLDTHESGASKLPSSASSWSSSSAKVVQPNSLPSTMHPLQSVMETLSHQLSDKEPLFGQHYQLKNEEDFPPLS